MAAITGAIAGIQKSNWRYAGFPQNTGQVGRGNKASFDGVFDDRVHIGYSGG
jgi:hypothetical protein